MAEFHLCILTPYGRQVIHVSERDFRCFVKYDPGLHQLNFVLIKLCEAGPERVYLTYCLVYRDGLNGLRVGVDHLEGGQGAGGQGKERREGKEGEGGG